MGARGLNNYRQICENEPISVKSRQHQIDHSVISEDRISKVRSSQGYTSALSGVNVPMEMRESRIKQFNKDLAMNSRETDMQEIVSQSDTDLVNENEYLK